MTSDDPTSPATEPSGEPLEAWSDDELLDHYRHTRDTFVEVDDYSQGERTPLDIIADEIRRRGLPVPDDGETHHAFVDDD